MDQQKKPKPPRKLRSDAGLPRPNQRRRDSFLHLYILDGHKPVPATIQQWEDWIRTDPNRKVAEDIIGRYRVSTIFIGVDHTKSWAHHRQMLFETMIFDHPDRNIDSATHPRPIQRMKYETWEDAAAGHIGIVERLLAQQSAREE